MDSFFNADVDGLILLKEEEKHAQLSLDYGNRKKLASLTHRKLMFLVLIKNWC